MRNLFTANYLEVFKFINEAYYEKFNEELSPPAFRLDCDQAVNPGIKSVDGPGTKIRLCCVHITRNWRKHLIEGIGQY